MKYLSKINRGAIFTTIVLMIVIGYLITTSIIQQKDIPEIKKICESYIQTDSKFNMLPEQYRVDNPNILKNDLNAYLAKMRMEIIAFYPPDEQYYKYAVEKLANDLTAQSKGVNVVFQYTKTVAEYTTIVFDGNTVDVSMLTNVTIEAKGLIAPGSLDEGVFTQQTQENIILQKTRGVWKVIYANLNRPSSNDGRPVKE